MSVAKITDKGNEVIFKKNIAYVKNQKQEILTVAERKGDLYFVHGSSVLRMNVLVIWMKKI